MEGVTLVESGTNRYHFAFIRKYEACKDALQADELICSTIAEVKEALQSKSVFRSTTQTSQLLLLLHCIDLHPCSTLSARSLPSIQFALIPALDLAATSEKLKDIWLAYTLLERLFAVQPAEEQLQTSLLLLNTIRQHLEVDSNKIERQTKGTNPEEQFASGKVCIALKSVIKGIPSGADIFPALYGPISRLCNHSDASVQGLAIDALRKIHSYLEPDEGLATAVWERVRGVLRWYLRDDTTYRGASLPKALLRAALAACQNEILKGEQLLDICLDLASKQNGSDVVIDTLQVCIEASFKDFLTNDQVGRIRSIAMDLLTRDPNDFASLLSVCSILSQVAASESMSSVEPVKTAWNMIRSHLIAKNANRKMLAIRALTALLPFQWFQAGNPAGLELSEMEMGRLLDMLGDRDDNVRVHTLSLVWQIDADVLQAHLKQLTQASQDQRLSGEERLRFSHYAMEAIGVQYNRKDDLETSAKEFAGDICELLSNSERIEAIDPKAVSVLLTRLRQARTNSAVQVLSFMLQYLHEQSLPLSATLVLLCATLSCEFHVNGSDEREILQRLSRLLTKLSSPASLEAILIAAIKVALDIKDIDQETMANVELIQGNESASVCHRAKQFVKLSASLEGIAKPPNGSLLEIMDWVDQMASKQSVQSESSPEAVTTLVGSSPRIARPLQYDTYDEQSSPKTSSSLSQSMKGTFSALPKPSHLTDDRSRRNRLKLEDQLHKEMQKSITRLTIGKVESDEETRVGIAMRDAHEED